MLQAYHGMREKPFMCRKGPGELGGSGLAGRGRGWGVRRGCPRSSVYLLGVPSPLASKDTPG